MKNKSITIITCIVSLLPMVILSTLYNKLPEKVAIHWNMAGEADNFVSRGILVFGIPIIICIVNIVINVVAKVIYGDSKEYAIKSNVLRWICPVLSWIIVISCMMMALK